MRRIAVLDAPSNLGLRPPTPTATPGCYKAPGALRDHGLIGRLEARDAGCLTPPRYDPGDWRPGHGVCHASSIAVYSLALSERIEAMIDAGEFPLVLGGDCSILLGSALAMHRLGESVGGRIGLVFVDGHSDFRHPGNAPYVGAAAGEDLALATGRGQADLAAIEGRRPYFRDVDVVVLGIRAQDEYRFDLQAAGIATRPVPALRVEGAARTAQWARDQLADCAGFWVHVDVDVLDPAVMPAVDAPDPGGIAFAELELLLAGLVDTPHCVGVELTVFDPDYDPDGSYAAEIATTVVGGLVPLRRPAPTTSDEELAGPDLADPEGLTNAHRTTGSATRDRAEVADADGWDGPEPGGRRGAADAADVTVEAGAGARGASVGAAADSGASGAVGAGPVGTGAVSAGRVGTGAGREPVGTETAGAEQTAEGRRPDSWADVPAAAPGRVRRSMDGALGDDLAAARRRRSMDDALGELRPGRLRRADRPPDDAVGGRDGWDDDPRSVRPHRSLDDALGGALAGRLRRVPDPADRDPADRDKADRDKADRDKADRDKADRDKADRDPAGRDPAERPDPA